ncbi:MAG TPA: cold shock domain-containing protein [Ilumatobacteraceae bacterium]
MPAPDATSGVVKFFNASRGYGFITQPGGADLFVHFSNITSDGFKTLQEGQRVTYEVRAGKRGLEAFDVATIAN